MYVMELCAESCRFSLHVWSVIPNEFARFPLQSLQSVENTDVGTVLSVHKGGRRDRISVCTNPPIPQVQSSNEDLKLWDVTGPCNCSIRIVYVNILLVSLKQDVDKPQTPELVKNVSYCNLWLQRDFLHVRLGGVWNVEASLLVFFFN